MHITRDLRTKGHHGAKGPRNQGGQVKVARDSGTRGLGGENIFFGSLKYCVFDALDIFLMPHVFFLNPMPNKDTLMSTYII